MDRGEKTMAMKSDVPCCSVCGEMAIGTLELVPGLALLRFNQEGEAEYEGETRMDWNNQITPRDSAGRATLECSNGHQWAARMDDGTRSAAEPVWRNHYQCPQCGHQWTDEWDSQCDDDCPACKTRHISPVTSEEIT